MSTQDNTSAGIISATGIMAAGTIVSRLTGFVRASMLAAAIGVSLHAEVFNVANTVPNSLYILVAGGVFNTVFVPQLVRAIKNDEDGGDAYANRVITLAAIVLAGITAILVLLAPQILKLLVDSSFFTEPQLAPEWDSMIAFARWCMPQIFFYGIYVLLGQILNAHGRFGPMMWAPIANNLIAIVVIGTYIARYAGEPAAGGYTTTQEVLLGLGSTFGIVVQSLVLIPFLRATGFRLRPRFDLIHTGLGHTIHLGMWTVGFVIVNQIAFYVMVHRATAGAAQVANGVPDASGYTVYANAFLITQVPHAIITVSLATATMPLLSRLAADGLVDQVSREMAQTLRLMLSVVVPFATALLVLGPALATVLFSWGQAAGDTQTLGWTLMAFAPGMIMFSVHYIVLRGFYAGEDTRTPFFIQCVIAATNIVLAITLTEIVSAEYVAPALALAYGGSYAVGAMVSLGLLSRRLGGLRRGELLAFVGRVAAAAVPSAAIAGGCLLALEAAGMSVSSKVDSLVLLAVGGVVGLGTYILLARMLRIDEIRRIVAIVAARVKRA